MCVIHAKQKSSQEQERQKNICFKCENILIYMEVKDMQMTDWLKKNLQNRNYNYVNYL